MPQLKRYARPVTAFLPPALAERLEKVAPTAEGQRSAFVREAIEAAVEAAERDQATVSAAP
jgi:predicted transcriptional regulator